MSLKIGTGYDIHVFTRGKKLLLGGVEIPYNKALKGHSDADCLLHAICDALLGALGKGDIGEHFPNNDPQFKGISSIKLLEKVYAEVKKSGYAVGNVDTVVLAEEPMLKAYKPKMRAVIAKALEIKGDCVNIKATTQEGLGAIGRKEGIAALATVILNKK